MATVFGNDKVRAFCIIFQLVNHVVRVFLDIFLCHYYSEIMPSIFDKAMYFSITASGFSILTFTETLVYLPVFDWLVLITAPRLLKASSTSMIFRLSVGTINLYKYSDGHSDVVFNSSLSLA